MHSVLPLFHAAALIYARRASIAVLIAFGLSAIVGCSVVGRKFDPPDDLILKPAEPAGLSAQFFGVTTLLISDGETSILVDGFFSRPGLDEIFLPLKPNARRIDAALARIDRVDAVLVAHAHHDHAMDAPVVAMKTGALLVGSKSTANVARRHGMHESRICTVTTERARLDVGKFRVTLIQTDHADGKPEIKGQLDQPLHPLATMWDYLPGPNYSFWLEHPRGNVLIVTSASADVSEATLKEVSADVVFLGAGYLRRLNATQKAAYWKATVTATDAQLVIPVHWDDFIIGPRDWPLQPPPKLFDDAKGALEDLANFAARQKMPFNYLAVGKPVDLPLYSRGRPGGSAASEACARAR